ncbi:hypothetical protein BH23CHL8_BH23CHL8_13210 [soil metagenome]
MLARVPDPDPNVPAEIVALARQRAQAREARDWQVADELRARIEGAGWKVVDAGTDFTLTPARFPDVVEDARVLYGGPASVPSRLESAPDRSASILLRFPGDAPTVEACLAGLRQQALPDLHVVVVADASGHDREATLALLGGAAGSRSTETGGPEEDPIGAGALDLEVLWTAAPLGPGASLAAAALRARGEVLIVLEPYAVPAASLAAQAVAALHDPGVALAGFPGRRSADLHRFEPSGPGPVTAVGAGCLAFRRRDAARRDPRDERLHLSESVAIWWSLLLRDEGPDATPRAALAIEMPFTLGDDRAALAGSTRDRLARRDAYRITERFGDRPQLATR